VREHPLPARLAPRRARRLVASVAPIALAALAVGCANNPVWPVREEPISYPPGALVALGLDTRSDSIVALSLEEPPRVLARVPLPLDPVALDGPANLVVDRARRAVFVALAPPLPPHPPGPHATHVLSLADGALLSLSLDTLRVRARARTEPSSSALALSPEGGILWVGSAQYLRALDVRLPSQDRGGAITAFDPDTLRPIALDRPCLVPWSLTADADGLAWVACFGEDAIASVRLRGAAIERGPRFAIGEMPGSFPAIRFAPRGVAIAPSSGALWTSVRDTRDLRAFSRVDGALLARVPTEGIPGPPRVDPDGARLTTREPGAYLHVRENSVASRLALDESMCVNPGAVLRSDDGRFHVLCEGDALRDGALLSLSDASPPAISRRVPIPGQLSALALVRP
jgi:hypothetical protein